MRASMLVVAVPARAARPDGAAEVPAAPGSFTDTGNGSTASAKAALRPFACAASMRACGDFARTWLATRAEAQHHALASVAVHPPDVFKRQPPGLLLDEPASALDPECSGGGLSVMGSRAGAIDLAWGQSSESGARRPLEVDARSLQAPSGLMRGTVPSRGDSPVRLTSGWSGLVRAALVLFFVLAATSASAEAGWLSSRGRLVAPTRLEAFVGTRSFGAGFVRTDTGNERAGLTFEGVVSFADRAAELRGARLFQLTETRFATATLSLGGAAFVVPDRAFDLGVGPQASLAVSLGGERFTVDLALQTGAEVFLRQEAPRLPQRAVLGLTLRLWEFTLSAFARIGADLVPGRNFIGRGELMVSVGWLGLDPALGRTVSTTPASVSPQR